MDEHAMYWDTHREPAARIITLGRVREQYDDLLRTFTFGGAVVEEVAEFSALLARLSRDPRPDLVVLGWEKEASGIETLRNFAESRDKDSAPLRAANPAVVEKGTHARPPGSWVHSAQSCAGDSARIEPKILEILKSVETLRAGANAGRDEAAAQDDGQALALGGLDLRFDTSRAFWKGRRVDLSLTEFRIVSRLSRSAGSDVSHRELYDIIKGEGFVSGTGKDGYRCNVRAAIKRIRQKFRLVDSAFAAIRNYHGFGYRWDEAARMGSETTGGETKDVAALDEPASCA
ncbi:MAG TPA: winged helix-turn-helix domain-containing protein [Acetobacteraceae bacterium]|nr:winged helix-turn-helix domain-containing protein [Acetobacteraceae bacterium]